MSTEHAHSRRIVDLVDRAAGQSVADLTAKTSQLVKSASALTDAIERNWREVSARSG